MASAPPETRVPPHWRACSCLRCVAVCSTLFILFVTTLRIHSPTWMGRIFGFAVALVVAAAVVVCVVPSALGPRWAAASGT
eukprot:6107063-Lingulodinium_polyedra.AAC.1